MTRPIVEANIEIQDDNPEVSKRLHYLATYLEEGDSLNIKAGDRVIKTTVTRIEKVPNEPIIQ